MGKYSFDFLSAVWQKTQKHFFGLVALVRGPSPHHLLYWWHLTIDLLNKRMSKACICAIKIFDFLDASCWGYPNFMWFPFSLGDIVSIGTELNGNWEPTNNLRAAHKSYLFTHTYTVWYIGKKLHFVEHCYRY